ncbi:MAG: 50S ribosomal protein L18Ae [Candidatus Micrarchaeota archaeon]|nr:50S ribosomal protein L18Ae [Candidatus Micrarchaeota archaeon]
MAKFVATGSFKSKGKSRKFEKVVEAPSEKLAAEKVLALLGSNAGIKRSAVKITSIEKL